MEFHLRFSDFEDYWSFIREFAGAVAILLRSFSDEQRAAVREATERATKEFRTAQGYDFPGLSCECAGVLTIEVRLAIEMPFPMGPSALHQG